MKELFQGRRLGFSPRPAIGFVAVGVGASLTLTDLMAWFAWGAKDTSGFVVVSYWLASAATIALGLAVITTVAEYIDTPEEERGLARLDLLASIAGFLLYGASTVLRGLDPSAAAAATAPFLLAIAALLVTFIDAALAANLYGAREWEELDEEAAHERHPRRRAASR